MNITDEALHLPVEARIALVDRLLESITPTRHEKCSDEYEATFRQRVLTGIAQAESGLLIASEDVEQEFAKRRAETLRQLNAQ